jgi:hypothetical protein
VIVWPTAVEHASNTGQEDLQSRGFAMHSGTSGAAIAASSCNAQAANARVAGLDYGRDRLEG